MKVKFGRVVCHVFWSVVVVTLTGTTSSAQENRELRKTPTAEPRIALVIGNSKYASSPLPNPVNDADAMAKALSDSGFKVIQRNNASQREMTGLLRDFGDLLRGGGVGVFYYAGHGMQVKGRNYLIPVDAQIEREDEVAFNSIDANQVLEKMDSAKNRLNIVVLDACRNNPFARSFRSAGQGLAQMEAPVGTLIAFATAPGSVASDGAGKNGLYTQHLLENMKKPGMKLEDIFKNVRASVRRESNGKQVPWESTSLEGDFYFASTGLPSAQPINAVAPPQVGASTLSDSAAYELAFWDAIKSSSNPEDYKAYLSEYPQGRFAALARTRSGSKTNVVQPSANTQMPTQVAPVIPASHSGKELASSTTELRERVEPAKPLILPVSALANAPSAPVNSTLKTETADKGAPIFKIGDQWKYAVYDDWKNQKTREEEFVVHGIENSNVIFNSGRYRTDASGTNTLTDLSGAIYAPREEFLDFPLTIGKEWSGSYEKVNASGLKVHHEFRAKVVRKEKVTVPAGTFDAVYVEQVNTFNPSGSGLPDSAQKLQATLQLWYAPDVKRLVKMVYVDQDFLFRTKERTRRELISYTLN